MLQVGAKRRGGKPSRRRRYQQYELQLAQASGHDISDDAAADARATLMVLEVKKPHKCDEVVWSIGGSLAANASDLPPMMRSLGSGRFDPFLKYPAELAPRDCLLLDYIMDPKTTALRSFRLTWHPLMWTGDPAVFYQALSNSCTALVRCALSSQLSMSLINFLGRARRSAFLHW